MIGAEYVGGHFTAVIAMKCPQNKVRVGPWASAPTHIFFDPKLDNQLVDNGLKHGLIKAN